MDMVTYSLAGSAASPAALPAWLRCLPGCAACLAR